MRILSFGAVTLDEAKAELRGGADRVPVQSKVLRVLLHLALHHGRTVTNEELLRSVWPKETVTSASIKRAIFAARKALGDDGESQRSIRTVRGEGYQLMLPVTIAPSDGSAAGAARLPAGQPPASVSVESLSPSGRASPRPRGAFVGRHGALALLRCPALRGDQGNARCVLLIGEPGIGKTTTLAELGRRDLSRPRAASYGSQSILTDASGRFRTVGLAHDSGWSWSPWLHLVTVGNVRVLRDRAIEKMCRGRVAQ